MTDKVDLEKPRRNLLMLSCILIFIELAGVKINGANVPGLSLTVQKPDLIVPFVWALLGYSIWRFWLLSKAQNHPFSHRSNKHVNRISHVSTAVSVEGFEIAGHMGDDYPSIKRSLFRRYAEFNPPDSYGQFSPESQTVRLSYLKMFFPEILGDLKTIATDKAFVEYTLPFLIAGVPILLFFVRVVVSPLYKALLA